jgi:hypothetical protein
MDSVLVIYNVGQGVILGMFLLSSETPFRKFIPIQCAT